MDYSSNDSGGDLKASKRILFAGVLGLTALKIVSACFHNYQLYEVDRLVSHISRSAEAEKRRKEAASAAGRRSVSPQAGTSTVHVSPALMPAAAELSADAQRASGLLPDASPLHSAVAPAASSSVSLSLQDVHAGPSRHDEGVDAMDATDAQTRLDGAVTSAAARAKMAMKDEEGDTAVDMSACSHGISSVAGERGAVSENTSSVRGDTTSTTAAAAAGQPPLPVVATTRHATPRSSLSSPAVSSTTSPQPMLRNNSGIFITAVHLVPGEPAPSTSQLISRLSMAGARSFSSPSPAASAHQRHREPSAASPAGGVMEEEDTTCTNEGDSISFDRATASAETGHSFSVVHVGVGGASVARGDAHDGTDKLLREEAQHGVVHEVDLAPTQHDGGFSLDSHGFAVPPPPVIIYEGAAPVNIDEMPLELVTAGGEIGLEQQPAGEESLSPPAFPSAEGEAALMKAQPKESEEAAQEAVESPLPYFSFTTTSVHIAKADVENTAAPRAGDSVHNTNGDGNHRSSSVGSAATSATSSKYISNISGVPRASVYVPALSTTADEVKPSCDAPEGNHTSEACVLDEMGGRSASAVSAGSSCATPATATANAAGGYLARPMVHLFIQPRWGLAPSLSPTCTKWETFLRLHHISYTVHEVHVLRSDHPQAQSTDVPQQIQHVVEHHRKKEGDAAAAAVVTEAQAFAEVLTETSAVQKVWLQVEAELRKVLPAGVLPGDLRTQYSLPFIMVGGTVLKGSFNDVMAELTQRGLVRPLCGFPHPAQIKTGEKDEATGAVAPASPYTPEEQRAIGQAVERTAEYTLRLLYEVGLLLEGSAVFSHYAAQLWSGHRYWDVFQIRRWFVYAWLAIPFLSALKADVERSLQGHELGGLTREQLYKSLQSDLVSLEQLLVASADTAAATASSTSSPEPDGVAGASPSPSPSSSPADMQVHFLLGKEPGPQDCALYAYLLPILRLSPRDIAHIHNPNFTYIYESRVFRGFVARMSAEAFPDLDVLLRPPRKPSFVMALSNVAWDYLEARATPALVSLRMRMDWLGARLCASMRPCQTALQRCLQQALTSAPARQARLLVQRALVRCQRLIPARQVPPSTPTAATPSRRQCRKAWWHFLDLGGSASSTTTGSGGAAVSAAATTPGDEDPSLSNFHFPATGAAGGAALRDAAVGTEDGRVVAAAPQRASAGVDAVLPPRRAGLVDSSTQVTESLEELTLPVETPIKKNAATEAMAAVDVAAGTEWGEGEEEVVVALSPLPGTVTMKTFTDEAQQRGENVTVESETAKEAEDVSAATAAAVEGEKEEEEAAEDEEESAAAQPAEAVEEGVDVTTPKDDVAASPVESATQEVAPEATSVPAAVSSSSLPVVVPPLNLKNAVLAFEADRAAVHAGKEVGQQQVEASAEPEGTQADGESVPLASAVPPPTMPAAQLRAEHHGRSDGEDVPLTQAKEEEREEEEDYAPEVVVAEASQPAARAGPLSPRVVHGVLSVSPARPETASAHPLTETPDPGAAASFDLSAHSTRSEANTVNTATTTTSTTSSPAITRREGVVLAAAAATAKSRSATSTSAPSPRAQGVAMAAVADGANPRVPVQRVPAARAISRSLGSTVEPGCTTPVAPFTTSVAPSPAVPAPVVAEKRASTPQPPQRSASPRLNANMAVAARPTTNKTRDGASAGPLRVPKKVTPTATRATRATVLLGRGEGEEEKEEEGVRTTLHGTRDSNAEGGRDGGDDDAASEASSSAVAESATTTSERQVSLTPSSSIARSATHRTTATTPSRQRRPSGLSPGLFTTVVNRKVYLHDGREHPSWKVEPRRRTSSATAEGRGSRASPAPVSRRASIADSSSFNNNNNNIVGRDGARSPATGALSRTVTPIRKVRPSPAGRPTV